MKTIELKLYKFSELSDEAKQKAIEKFSDINVDYEWWNFVYEDFTEKAKNAGFDVSKIYFSGFWSQGDGAMFEYSLNGEKLVFDYIDSLSLSPLRKKWLKNWIDYSGSGKHSGHYYHQNCCNHSIEFCAGVSWSVAINVNNWIDSFAEGFEDYVVDIYKDLCRDLYKSLEKEYEYLTSEEAIIETIECNEYDFLENGKMY